MKPLLLSLVATTSLSPLRAQTHLQQPSRSSRPRPPTPTPCSRSRRRAPRWPTGPTPRSPRSRLRSPAQPQTASRAIPRLRRGHAHRSREALRARPVVAGRRRVHDALHQRDRHCEAAPQRSYAAQIDANLTSRISARQSLALAQCCLPCPTTHSPRRLSTRSSPIRSLRIRATLSRSRHSVSRCCSRA